MKLKKLASLAMSGVLCVSMLAACGGGSSSSAAVSGSAASGSASAEGTGNVTPVGEYPIVNEPITFKIMGAKDPGAPDWSELEVFQRLSEITNINFEFEVSETGTWPEQKNIALVGGEYGDIILRDKSATDANMAVTDEETYGPHRPVRAQHQGHDGKISRRQSGHDEHGRQDLRPAVCVPHGHRTGPHCVFQ